METVGLLLLIENQGEQEVFQRAAQSTSPSLGMACGKSLAAKRFLDRDRESSAAEAGRPGTRARAILC